MAIEIECPKCEMCYAAPDHLAGRAVECPECGQEIIVPISFDDLETDELGLAYLEPEKPKAAAPKTGGAKPRSPSTQKPKPQGPTSFRAKAPAPAPRTPTPPKPAPLEPQQYDPLSDLLDEDLAAGPAVGGQAGVPLAPAGALGSPAGAGGPWSGGLAGGGTLPPMKRKRPSSSGGSPFLRLIRTRILALIFTVVVPIAFVFNLVFSPPWLAVTVLAVGGLIAFFGFTADPHRPLFTKPDFKEEGAGCATCVVCYIVIGAFFRAMRRVVSGDSGLPFGVAIVCGLVMLGIIVAGIFLLFRFFARMFGGFRTAAITYLALGVMHVMLIGMGLALFGAAKFASQGNYGRPEPPAPVDKIAVPEMPQQPAAPVATDWKAQPDPLPTTSAGLEAIPLKTTEREVWQVRFSAPRAARAVVLGRPADRQGNHYFIDTYDLARRRYLGRFKVPRTAQLTDVSADGRRALTVTESQVHVWSLEEGRPLVDWHITHEGETGRGPAWFVGSNLVLTHDSRKRLGLINRDRLIVWSLPECKPAYAVKGVSNVALSPGRKYVVAFLVDGGGSAATVYRAATGRPCGNLPSPPSAHGRYDPLSWGFSGDGRLLAASGGPLAVWDFSDGKLLAESSRGLSSGSLQFLGNDFLIQGGDLFDRGRNQRIWRYRHPSSSSTWSKVFGSPNDRVWTLVARSQREPAYLVPLELPDRETRAAIASGSLPGPGEPPRTSRVSFDTVFGTRQPPGPLAENVPPGYGQGAEALVSAGSHRAPRPPIGPVGPPRPPDPRPLRPKPTVGPTVTPPAEKPGDEKPPAGDFDTASRDYVRRFYTETIAAADDAVVGMVQWLPAARQPVLGLRWGVGLYHADAQQQPPAGDARAMGGLTGGAGPALVAGLEKRMAEGVFGIWPEEGDRRLREIALLGSGRQPDLVEAARRRGLDLLMIFTLSERTVVVSKKQFVMLRVRILDVTTGRQLWTSEPVSTQHAQSAGLAKEVLKEIDEEFRLAPVPGIRPERAAARVARLAATASKSEPGELLRVLLELRYYQAKGLVEPEDLVPLYDKILGRGKGRTMATGTAAQRRQVLAEWLKGR